MEADASNVALIILGAGLGSRFAIGDKLAADYKGKPVAHHVLAAVAPFNWGKKILVHHHRPQWSDLFVQHGFELVENGEREQGMLSSLHLGAEAARELPRAMICLADMPLVDSGVIAALLARAEGADSVAVASRAGDYRGPPALFPTHLLQSLPKTGEGGARSLLKDAVFVDCDESVVRDIDTVEDLKSISLD